MESNDELIKTINKLQENIANLNKKYKREHSFKFNFVMSIVRGVGTAIGATIIAGILIAILSKTIDSVNDVPILNKLVEQDVIQNIGK